MDLRASLSDELRRIEREEELCSRRKDDSEITDVKIDRSFKEGETIDLNLNFSKKKKKPKAAIVTKDRNEKFLLNHPPKPSAANLVLKSPVRTTVAASVSDKVNYMDDDEFGDFQ